MINMENINLSDRRFQAFLQSYLRVRSNQGPTKELNAHLDEDTLTAFAEGNLTMREADPLVAHLSDCSFCRHKTAELVRLDLAFAEMDAVPASGVQAEPARVSERIGGILNRLFGHGESAVFAHEEKKPETSDDDSENQEDSK